MFYLRSLLALVVVFACLLLSPLSCLAEVPDRAALVSGDARLNQKITFSQRLARIGEVFEAVEKQTGVHLTVEDRDGAAGELISVFVRDMPIADLMTNVWSLVSFQRGEWRWIVTVDTQKKTVPVYRLTRSVAAREFPKFVQTEIKKYFEELMEANIRNSYASVPNPKDAKKFPESAFGVNDKSTRLKLRAFAALCPPAERLLLLRGEKERELAKKDWLPEITAYVDNEVQFTKKAFDSHPEWRDEYPNLKLPNPERIHLYGEQGAGKLTPNLWFGVEGMGSVPAVGSTTTEAYWENWVADAWLMPGDAREDEIQEKLVITTVTVDPKSNTNSVDTPNQAVMRLKQLHEQTGLPVLARLTGASIFVSQDPKKIKTVADAAATLRESHVLLKWRNGALLAMDPAWLRRATDLEKAKTPWAVLRVAREQITADPVDSPSLATVCRLASVLSPEQLLSLGKLQTLLPVNASVTLSNFCQAIVQYQPLLAEMDRHPELQAAALSEEGIAVRALSPAMQEWAKPLLGGQIPLTVRLRIAQTDWKSWVRPARANTPSQVFTGSRYWRMVLYNEGVTDPILPSRGITAREFSWDGYVRTP